ncbi:MAG: 5'-3' exonuclease H3TH domain-containing protein [Actinomycetota bacterium]
MTNDLTLLIDASSLIYRAYFSTPDTVRAPDGRLVNAAHGFLGMIARLVHDHNPRHICCAADEDWRPEWRVELIDTYKTHRTLPSSIQQQADRELERQVPIIFGLLQLCGIEVIGHPGYEAEDVIGTLAARASGPVAIVSGDRDLFQLVRDPDVFVLFPRRGVSLVDRVDETYIEERFGIPGRSYRDFAVLRGDSSDGLPGVRGIGDKIAASLLRRYGSLSGIMSAAEAHGEGIALSRVQRDLDYIKRALQVVTIPTDLPLPQVDLRRPLGDPEEAAYPFAQRLGLSNAVTRLIASLRSERSGI